MVNATSGHSQRSSNRTAVDHRGRHRCRSSSRHRSNSRSPSNDSYSHRRTSSTIRSGQHSSPKESSHEANCREIRDLLRANTAGKKRKRVEEDYSFLKACEELGRFFPRNYILFTSAHAVFAAGSLVDRGTSELRGNDDDDDEDSSQMSQEEIQSLYKVYEQILRDLPDYYDNVKELRRTYGNAISKVVETIHHAATAVRADDTNACKTHALKFLLKNPLEGELSPPLRFDAPKALRGIKHPQTRRMLVPMHLVKKYDSNHKNFHTRVERGNYQFSAEDFPVLLYHEDIFDILEPWNGLLISDFLFRVWLLIFRNPSTALSDGDSDKSTKEGNAEKHGMLKVTPASIAYAAVQGRVALSTQDHWAVKDGSFDYKVFYNNLLELFNIRKEWGVSLLEYWNFRVFGKRPAGYVASKGPTGMSLLLSAWEDFDNRNGNQLDDEDAPLDEGGVADGEEHVEQE